jgi:hypothetical protein
METVINKLSPWINTCSLGISLLNYKHGDEIVVGGKIKNILSLKDIIDENAISILVDDGFGTIRLYVPDIEKVNQMNLQNDQIIIGSGRIYDPENEIQNKHSKLITTIICWDLKVL